MASLAYKVVDDFEKTIADWCGSKYAVAVESCTAALFLTLMYVGVKDEEVEIPCFTYPSVPCQIIHAGGKVKFVEKNWTKEYQLGDTGIWDSALRFDKGMYQSGFTCLSFHSKKLLPIGRGGMILTDDYEAYKWLKKARFDGRDEVALGDDELTMLGWNMYMMPEQASRGLMLFDVYKNNPKPPLDVESQGYPNLSLFPIYTK